MTPEEQQALAAQGLQTYQAPPQAWDPAIADQALQSYAAPPPPSLAPLANQALQGYGQSPGLPAEDQQAIANAALQGMGAKTPGLSLEDQRALGNAALTGYGALPAQGLTPGLVSDAQMLHPQATDVAAQEESAQYAQRNGVDARSQDEKMAAAQQWAQGSALAASTPPPQGDSAMAVAAVPPSAVAANTAPTDTPPPSRGDWSQTKLTPEEEAQFQQDMVTKPGYKDWYEAAKKDWGHAPDFDDPENDYDYRGAWKGGVVPAVYKHDGKYHWSSSLDNGQMLKAPDHPTAWMEYFMRATGKDPNDVGVKNEHEAVEYMGKNPQVRAAAETAIPPEAITPFRPAAKTFPEGLKNFIEEAYEKGAAEKRAKTIEAQGEKAEADLTKEQASEIDERLKRHTAAVDAQMEDIRRTKAAMEDANLRSEQSSHIEHKETTRSKIAGLLAIFGGGLADAFAIRGGAENPQYLAKAQEGLDKVVQQDLAQQRERYNNDKEAAKRAGDAYAMAVDIFGQTPEADKFTNILNGQRNAAELAAQAAQSKNANVQAAGTVIKETTEKDAAEKAAELLAGVRRAQVSGGRGSALDKQKYSAQELLEKLNRGELLTPRETQIAQQWSTELRARENIEGKQETAEEKAAAAKELERAEFIPGFKRKPGMVPLSPKTIDRIEKDYDSATGVDYMARLVAGYWNTVMDKSLPDDVRADARTKFMAEKQRLLSGDSVDTGQGTITASDAKRMGGAWPELPANISDIPWYFENKWKGQLPSADTYLEYGRNALDQRRTQLAKAYGLVPSEEADALWAEHDAKQPKAPEKAPPRYEAGTKPPEKPASKGETKSALPPPPEGKVAVIRLKDGVRFYATPAEAEKVLASGKYRAE